MWRSSSKRYQHFSQAYKPYAGKWCTHLKNVDYRLIIIPEIQHLKSSGGRWPIKRVLLSHLWYYWYLIIMDDPLQLYTTANLLTWSSHTLSIITSQLHCFQLRTTLNGKDFFKWIKINSVVGLDQNSFRSKLIHSVTYSYEMLFQILQFGLA